jgi:hypothetical protein
MSEVKPSSEVEKTAKTGGHHTDGTKYRKSLVWVILYFMIYERFFGSTHIQNYAYTTVPQKLLENYSSDLTHKAYINVAPIWYHGQDKNTMIGYNLGLIQFGLLYLCYMMLGAE